MYAKWRRTDLTTYPLLRYLYGGDGKQQLRTLAPLAPVEMGVDDEETVAELWSSKV
jgi:hypothetical protein